ncbi:RagB/SusD family nutrient uptake outer membrane protein [Bacteroides sp. 214]|uniref:RagB/SusD family nutrient uptake outer membrane protein n=1 Tax=Bacteroides sp. 214 TaxID=2302935 RepID=UPI0013CF8095|nr:RagB/SusD family nutrient uptake outer membrane protein [Bacteroides sp. 214]NDW13897.1 RagB/SusD family nutrient uptake outer membrane protein [Bacteroides sp. 214]
MKKHLYLGIILILSAVINAQAGIELPEITNYDSDFMEAIMHERAWEFGCEGIRTISWPVKRNDGDGRFFLNDNIPGINISLKFAAEVGLIVRMRSYDCR